MGEFPSIDVEEENVEPNTEVLQRGNRVSIGYTVSSLVKEECKRDEEDGASKESLFSWRAFSRSIPVATRTTCCY